MKSAILKRMGLISFLGTLSLFARAESVVQREVAIGAADFTYVDPEINESTMQVSMQSMKDGALYVGQLDPVTGRFVDHNYRYIDTPAKIYHTFNGPEWGYCAQGTGIYYTKPDANGYFHNFRYRDGKVTQLDSGDFNLVANYPTKKSTDAAALVMGANFPPSSLQVNPLVINWGVLSEDKPTDIRYYPMVSIGKGPRYVPGARQAITNLLDTKGNLQVAIFDFDSAKVTQATFDADRKNSGVVFNMPELGNEQVLSAMILSELGQSGTQQSLLTLLPNAMLSGYDKLSQTLGQVGQAIRIYRKVAGQWRSYKEVRPQNGNLLMNYQVFTYNGKTYFSMEQFNLTTIATNHQIVIQDAFGKVNLSVGGDAKMVRFDPEVAISGSKIFTYYYNVPGFHLYMSELTLP